jgi:hypothetical protein
MRAVSVDYRSHQCTGNQAKALPLIVPAALQKGDGNED